ncbi:hypothetical protein F443_03462, partial [Phytophthora nicotianae P1569]
PYFGLSQTPTTTTIQMCDGVSFRQCQLPGLQANSIVVGMCYNHRMQVLACNTDPDTIQVRIRQIQKRQLHQADAGDTPTKKLLAV